MKKYSSQRLKEILSASYLSMRDAITENNPLKLTCACREFICVFPQVQDFLDKEKTQKQTKTKTKTKRNK